MGRKSRYTAQLKARVAFEAAKGDRTINEIALEYGVHPAQVRAWKREFMEKMHLAFERDTETLKLQRERAERDDEGVLYNRERPHRSLGYVTPDEVYYGGLCGIAA